MIPVSAFSVLHRCDAILLFKHILEIGLTGKTEIAADFCKAFIAVSQQAFGFLKLTSCDKGTDMYSKLFFKAFHNIGAAPVNLFCDIVDANGFIGVAPYIVHALLYFLRYTLRYLCLTSSLAKIHEHDVLQGVDLVD